MSSGREISLPRHRRYTSWATVVLMAVAGVATSWNGFEAARWGSVQSHSYGRASALRIESTRADSTADQLLAIDVAVFMGWVEAHLRGDVRLAEFYEERFREELKPAFRAWLAQDPFEHADAAPTPFHLQEYRLAKAQEAIDLTERAEDAFQEGQEASRYSDAYIMNAVKLATVLFFAGISKAFRVHSMQYVLLGVATALLAICGWTLVTLPTLF